MDMARDPGNASCVERLLEHSAAGLAAWDGQLRCLYANAAFAGSFDLNKDQLPGMSLAALLGPEGHARHEPLIREALQGRAVRCEIRRHGRGGAPRAVVLTCTPDILHGQVLGLFTEVTRTGSHPPPAPSQGVPAEAGDVMDPPARSHENLARLQQAFSDALAGVGAGFLATDADGRVTRLNAAALRLLGWTPEQALGRPLWQVLVRQDLDPTTAARHPNEVMLELHGAAAGPHEVIARAADGRSLSLELRALPMHAADGSLQGLALVMRDLARRRAGESDRDVAESRFRLVFEASSSALLITDRSGRIVMLNRQAEQLFGYRREELQGQMLDVLVPETVRAAHRLQVARYFVEPRIRPMGSGRELLARRRDGSEVAVEIGLDPIAMPDGPHTLASVVDITLRKRHHDELRRSNAELEQFAYVASHDLQEPLRMVASFTELLAQRYQGRLDEKADKYIHYAVDGARRMQQLIADLLSYSRVGSQGKPLVPLALDEAWRQALMGLQVSVNETGAHIEADALPLVRGDLSQLAQLFQNLVANAIKFRGDEPPRIAVKASLRHDHWLIEVRDNGIGFEMQYAQRIFQMFQRLHERGSYDGSGIGLAIVKRIVERHEGCVWAESKPGGGTSFFFTLRPAEGGSTAA